MTNQHVQLLLRMVVLFSVVHCKYPNAMSAQQPPPQAPRRLQNEVSTTSDPEFDILCQRTYDSFDWIILIGSVLILMCVALCCGWTAHILWIRDEYDPRLSLNCSEMQMPKMSPPISPSLSDKMRAKFIFAGSKLRGLKDRYSKRHTQSEPAPQRPPPLDLPQGQALAQAYAQGDRHSQGYGHGRPQTPGLQMPVMVSETLNGNSANYKEQGHAETQTPMLSELSMGDETTTATLTTPRMGSLSGTGLRLCTAETMDVDGKGGIRSLTVASTEEKWTMMTPKIITPPGSEHRDRADRYSTPL